MKHSESLKSIAPAIKIAQGAIEGAIKDAQNPFFKNKYADLESCWKTLKPALQANGLSVVQTMGFMEKAGPTLITTLLHESGEYITGEQPICAKADDPQAMGSAISYARRYGMSAIMGLIQVDDDAESAVKRPRASFKDEIPPFEPPMQGTVVSLPQDPGKQVCPFGNLRGRTFEQIGKQGLAKERDYWIGRSRTETISKTAENFINAINQYLAQ